ncbi:ADP-ribosylglycohydrolase family protein [Microbulbifer marinus]|uniref:ADP-ribosylglycohydrolase n=1 Tax=Microbulbifer marinus TaxID=658218 RepID=A0A1H3WGD5_9GAMM|nr:ADP-ribosylglycohydrolase family protein [Microbulbifer marinus]SDZ85871.1 ADP-ribosylglycohydrolase [Microbulbifer marinus]
MPQLKESLGPTAQQRFRGCLLGGAVGDALGAPVEFLPRADILQTFGLGGITHYAPAYGREGAITDDTQMTLFTAEGLLRAWVRGQVRGIVSCVEVTARAYIRWLQTQGEPVPEALASSGENDGWLLRQEVLHSRRAPGATCLSALKDMKSLGMPADNDSKGCGGVMRVAPVGLFNWRRYQGTSVQETFRLASDLAALTHGHPTGALTAGVLAVVIQVLTDGKTLQRALQEAKNCLRRAAGHQETLAAIENAEHLAAAELDHQSAISQLGQGWVAEEALAVSIYCALVATDFSQGVILAVNHDGDSDSTGSITGNLLGAMLGDSSIPRDWLAALECRDVIQELADDLFGFPDWEIGGYGVSPDSESKTWEKYPGC